MCCRYNLKQVKKSVVLLVFSLIFSSSIHVLIVVVVSNVYLVKIWDVGVLRHGVIIPGKKKCTQSLFYNSGPSGKFGFDVCMCLHTQTPWQMYLKIKNQMYTDHMFEMRAEYSMRRLVAVLAGGSVRFTNKTFRCCGQKIQISAVLWATAISRWQTEHWKSWWEIFCGQQIPWEYLLW